MAYRLLYLRSIFANLPVILLYMFIAKLLMFNGLEVLLTVKQLLINAREVLLTAKLVFINNLGLLHIHL